MDQIKKITASLLIILFSTGISLVLAEIVCRVAFNAVDYLSPDRIPDPVLRYRIEPGSGGHDNWGFRNKTVPDNAGIVVIGDSQTYGYNSTLDASYPAQLQKLMGITVYNLSLGGYGPVQYKYLLEEYALKLKPKVVIAGLYFGNDFADAFNSAYSLDHWKMLRQPSVEKELGNIKGADEDVEQITKAKTGLSQSIRHWLAGHSILYQLITKVAFRNLGSVGVNTKAGSDGNVIFKNTTVKVEKIFTPESRFKTLDTTIVKIREGIRITLQSLEDMDSICKKNNIKFITVFIPTAETAYSSHFDAGFNEVGLNAVMKLVNAEKQVKTIVRDSLTAHQVSFVDAGEALKTKVGVVEGMYLPGPDGHPTAAGYGVIAEALKEYLNQNKIISQ